MDSERVNRVFEWVESLRDISPRNALPVRSNERSELPVDQRGFREAMIRSLGADQVDPVWRKKGIYVWYWRPKMGEAAWPLYVGKAQRGRSTLRSRLDRHIRHALRGVDFIYSPTESRVEARLHPLHSPLVGGLHLDHIKRVREQFSELSIILLPMEEDTAVDLAGIAEGMILESIIWIHEDAGRPGAQFYDQVMNSTGRAFNASHLRGKLGPLKDRLRKWMV